MKNIIDGIVELHLKRVSTVKSIPVQQLHHFT